ncbi:MAG: cytochrome c [Gemmatimonadaceae bacterium]|nr:cytochrome c [Gemmatimonadaceae bacterium]
MPMRVTRVFMFAAALGASAAALGAQRPDALVARRAAHTSSSASVRVYPPVNKYNEVCAACHQQSGLGIEGAFPPLAGSEWLLGRPDIPIAIVLHGLQGPITVKGAPYNSAMMAWGTSMSDDDIAGTLTYARSQWGNKAAAITAAQVRAVRAKFAARTQPWTAAELKAIK